MSPRLSAVVGLAAIGAFLGAGMGIAFGGDAISGTVVLGVLGAVLGMMMTKDTGENRETDKATESDRASGPVEKEFSEGLQGVLRGVESLLGEVLVVLRAVWNLEMRILRKLNLMSVFTGRAWLFFAVGFVLLAFVFPLGVVFVASAIAASLKDPEPENDYIVPIR